MGSAENRPKKPFIEERLIPIATDSEVAMRTISDTSGNPVYHGRAMIGTTDSTAKWQIFKIKWDAAGNHEWTKWPQINSLASQEHLFTWDDAATVTISGITKANPGVVTTSSAHGFSNGDNVVFESISGMTELEFSNVSSKIYIVANKTSTTFEITDQDGANVDTSGYTTFVSGGCSKITVANYTYS